MRLNKERQPQSTARQESSKGRNCEPKSQTSLSGLASCENGDQSSTQNELALGQSLDSNGDDALEGVAVTDPADLPSEKKKKKKKHKKPASKRGLVRGAQCLYWWQQADHEIQGKPTGMEEFYAAPMTPEEYEEQQQLYDP